MGINIMWRQYRSAEAPALKYNELEEFGKLNDNDKYIINSYHSFMVSILECASSNMRISSERQRINDWAAYTEKFGEPVIESLFEAWVKLLDQKSKM
jgi:hypothetical protein